MVKMPHWPIPSYGSLKIDLDLSRIRILLQKLGNPHLTLPPTIHVSGTNGKGSTISYLRSVFQKSGYKVHSYTSPHLIRFNERIYLANNEISDSDLYQYAEECRMLLSQEKFTFFEATTAMAFLAFSRVHADVLLLEVGMGGRLDATNVIDNPILTIITPISSDHTEYLGNTITEIAREKGGIIKFQRPCIISWQMQEAMNVLLETCNIKKAPVFSYDNNWQVHRKSKSSFVMKIINRQIDEKRSYKQNTIYYSINSHQQDIHHLFDTLELSPSLPGIHQFINASTAAFASLYLSTGGMFPNISVNAISYGISHAYWPARLQRIDSGVLHRILPSQTELWLDGAHNIGGAEMLAASISNMPSKPLYLIHGRTKNRDIASFLYFFQNITKMICCVTVENEPMAEKAEIIHQVASSIGFVSIVCSSLDKAIKQCLQHASSEQYTLQNISSKVCDQNNDINAEKYKAIAIRILICGSLYLAGDVLNANDES